MPGQGTCGSGAAACIAVDQALAFVDGTLVAAERAVVEHRIDACAACRAVVADAARSTGVELVPDAARRTSVQRQPQVTAPLRSPRAAAVPDRRRTPHPTPPIELRHPKAPARAAAHAPTPVATPRAELARRPAASPADHHDRPTGDRDRRTSASQIDSVLGPGDVVGRYVVERPLGAGGMGVVSLARDPELRRAVVIKLVHPDMGEGEGGDELEARLRREAQAMAQVSHTNVVQIFDIGRRGDRVFLAMEFIDGQTLDQWLRVDGRNPPIGPAGEARGNARRCIDEILEVFRQAGAGLAAAHRAGLVHRDFKPSNVLVGRDGVVKVTDFGLARSVAASGAGATRQIRMPEARAPQPSGVHAVLTEANAVVGTPAYMAPEQAAGKPLDARTDQYALAVTLLDALLGQSPIRRAVAPADPPAKIDQALTRAGVAGTIRGAVVRALTDDPAGRFPSIDEFLRALIPRAVPGPAKSRRAAMIIAGVALCGIAAAAWLALGHREPACTADAPRRWRDRPRAVVIDALSRVHRPFAAWDAERVAAAIDGAVDAIGAAETARCRGAPLPDPQGSAGCIARRTTALSASLAALSASPPPDDPWALVRPIERCDPPDRAAAELRGRLRDATVVQARDVAAAAHKLGDELLAADAFEVAGLAALVAGDTRLASDQFRTMSAAGLQADSGAVQGRALLHLIEVARIAGEYELASQHLVALDALLRRYHDPPRDVLAVALAEGEAFADLGDVATAFSAWERAHAAATTLGDRDGLLAAEIGRAWSTYVLRSDLAAARAAAGTAVAGGATASPVARATALGVVAQLALEADDGRAAQQALDEANRLAPERPTRAIDRLRAQRARALLGDVDGAVAALVPAASDDAVTAARVAIVRGKVLLAADHASEAISVLDKVSAELRGYGSIHATLPIAERLDLELAACDAQIAVTGACKASYRIDLLVAGLHPRAPVRARLALIDASNEAATASTPSSVRASALSRALGILVDAGAEPLRIAELRWQIAQLCPSGSDCRALAGAAREAFVAAGRSAEVAAIDRWLVDQPPTPSWISRDAGIPDAAPPSRRDPWGPQP